MPGMENTRAMKICILGAGMGGLTAALALAKKGFENIEVYEFASDLGFVGAGIQLAPNMARILDRLGVWAPIEKEACEVREASIRQGSSDEELARVDLTYVEPTYGYKHMVGHRSSLAGSIYAGCRAEKNIKFHFSSPVARINSFGPKASFTVEPRDGSAPYDVEADVILGADGVKSIVRVGMLQELGVEAEVEDSGQAAYRIVLTREQMSKFPDVVDHLDHDRVTRWVGDRRHIIAYPIASKSLYNISTAQPDVNFADAPSATYTTKGSKKAMLNVYGEYCDMIHRMLDLVPEGEVCEWRLRVHAPLPTWVHHTTALLGDACHPTLPHLNQGAAQAIEDAATIGVVLSRIPDASPENINKAFKIYEKVRKQRAETLVALAAANGKAMQLGEGAAKEERDRQFAALKEGKGPVPDKWADADVQKMIYGHDCMMVAEEEFKESFAKL